MAAPDGAQIPRTAVDLWESRVSASGEGVAYRYHQRGAWQSMTWREADGVAREIAGGLAALGVGRGDPVCLLAQTRLDWVLADLGIVLSGAATVPIYASSTAEQCAFIARDCGAKVVIVEDAAQLEKVLPLTAQMPGLVLIYLSGDAQLERPDGQGRTRVALGDVLPVAREPAPRSLEALRAAGREYIAAQPGEIERRSKALVPTDLMTIIYTSGTTGNPKGVVLTHENVVSACASAVRALDIRPDDVQYLFLPLAHVFGREAQWAVVITGASTALTRGMNRIRDDLAEIRPTFVACVPRIFEKFYAAVQTGVAHGTAPRRALASWAFAVGKRHAAAAREGRASDLPLRLQHLVADRLVLGKLRRRLGLDRCRFMFSGGAPLSAEIAEFFQGVGLMVLEGYGLTETMAAAFVNRPGRIRIGTVGTALDVVEVKIADDGEILLRGPSVFKRYHANPAATAEAIDPHGWFHTGDIGELDDGSLRITDRKKDLIITAGGKKVAPQVLENSLKTRSSLVSQVMVYGDRRPYCVALVTLNEEAIKRFGAGDAARAAASSEARAAIQRDIDAVNSTLASFESIKSFAIVPQDFTEASGELTPSMKIKRKVIIERHRGEIDGLYGGRGASAASTNAAS
jgi:long-chain acyl-CoA synthetase